MLKVMIADDEEKVCWLIDKLIRWDELGMERVACVHDGATALKTILQEKPNIVITDVRMPEMDGLEVIRNVMEAGVETTFVVVSGHRQFEYAYSALKYGVEDYLLKPIKREEINHILQRIGERLREQHAFADGQREQKALQNTRCKLLRQQFVVGLLEGRCPVEDFAAADCALGFRLTNGTCYMLEVHVDVALNCIDSVKTEFVCTHIRDMLDELLRPAMRDMESVIQNSSVVTLVCVEFQPPHALLTDVIKKIRQYAETFDCYLVSVSISDAVNDAKLLPDAAAQAHRLLGGRLLIGSERLLMSGMCPEETHIEKEVLFNRMARHAIRQSIEAIDVLSCRSKILQLFETLRKRSDVSPGTYYALTELISEFVYQVLGEHMWMEELIAEDRRQLARCIENTSRADELAQVVAERIGVLILKSEDQRRQQDSKPVRIARRYIAEHYSETLTLERVAAVVDLSAAYFSIIFKQETGWNFSEFLTDLRIQNAKKLLETTSDTIAAVADAVGYHDVKYFSRLFTKMVGITPATYRKLHA